MLEVFYDGACAFCCRQADKIRKRNNGSVRLTDISENPFVTELYGISVQDALYEIHGVDGDGQIYRGFDLVIELMKALNYRKLAWISSTRLCKPVLSFLFSILSKYRKKF